MDNDSRSEMIAKMTRAFNLVCPRECAMRLAERGALSRELAEGVSWRGPIGALVSDADLEAAGTDIDEVGKSVVFFTGTVPRVTRERLAGAGPGYLVVAAGYSAGPCA